MPNPVVHWEVHGRDGKKLEEFYRNLFNWHVEHVDAMNYGSVDTHAEGGINGGIGQIPGEQTQTQPFVTFYVQVNDLDDYLKRAEGLGATTLVPPTEIPNIVTFAMFADPEGNVIGLVKEGTM